LGYREDTDCDGERAWRRAVQWAPSIRHHGSEDARAWRKSSFGTASKSKGPNRGPLVLGHPQTRTIEPRRRAGRFGGAWGLGTTLPKGPSDTKTGCVPFCRNARHCSAPGQKLGSHPPNAAGILRITGPAQRRIAKMQGRYSGFEMGRAQYRRLCSSLGGPAARARSSCWPREPSTN